MTDSRDDHILTNLHRVLNGLAEAIREVLAASGLLRARVESNDGILNRFANELDALQNYTKELDRRLTRLENEKGVPHEN